MKLWSCFIGHVSLVNVVACNGRCAQASSAPSPSISADASNAEFRIQVASVIAPIAIGPNVWPTPNTIVIAAMAVGHACCG